MLKGNTQRNGTGATSWLRWFATASHRAEAQAASATHKTGRLSGSSVEDCERSAISVEDKDDKWSIAAMQAAATTTAYPMDHQFSCWLPRELGSISTGYARRATTEARFDSAKRRQGKAAVNEAEYHACRSGLVEDKRK